MARFEGERTRVVEADDCATRWGNDGLFVLSTPAILGYLEMTCVEVLASHLDQGQMTVGVGVSMSHQASVARGNAAIYRVSMARDGRDIEVEFTVTDENGTVVSTGRHQRRVVDRERFLQRLAGVVPATTDK